MRKRQGLVWVCALACGAAVPARAAVTCSTADYRGTYAFYSTGTLFRLPAGGASLPGPFAQAGTFTADGKGNLVIESQASYNGLVLNGDTEATYSVTPECVLTYSLTLPAPLNAPATFTGVLSAANRLQKVMISDPQGSQIVGRHLKQDLRSCSTGDFRGAYAIDLSGSIAPPAGPAGLFQRIGRLVADGSGGFSATTKVSYGGRMGSEDFEGAYEVSEKCFVTLRYRYGGQDMTIRGPLAAGGSTVMMMVASPGWAVSGELRAQ